MTEYADLDFNLARKINVILDYEIFFELLCIGQNTNNRQLYKYIVF